MSLSFIKLSNILIILIILLFYSPIGFTEQNTTHIKLGDLIIISKYAVASSDFDEVDDTRNFMSEALLSKTRMVSLIYEDTLRSIIRFC